jgi:hypothetical protein
MSAGSVTVRAGDDGWLTRIRVGGTTITVGRSTVAILVVSLASLGRGEVHNQIKLRVMPW